MAKDVEAQRASKQKSNPTLNGRPIPSAPLKTEVQGASIDDLSDRLQTQGVNQDVAMFIAHNWQRLAGGLVVVLLGVVLYYQYKHAQDTRVGDASKRYDTLTADFDAFEQPKPPEPPSADAAAPAEPKTEATAEKEKKPDEAAALKEQLRSLQATHGDTIYARLGQLYSAQLAIQEKDISRATETLSKFSTDRYKNAGAPKRSTEVQDSSLVDELAAMEKARLLLSQGDAQRADARKLLTGVAFVGRFMNLEASLALLRTSKTPEELGAAKDAISKLLGIRPELRQIFASQLETQGYSIAPAVS